MKPGSWLEISDLSFEKASNIYSQGNIEVFIVNESANKECPEFPFMLKINSLQEAEISLWRQSPHFKGFLLKTDKPLPPRNHNSPEKLWVDYQVKDIKNAGTGIKTFIEWNVKGYFLTFTEEMSSHQIHQFLSKENIFTLPRPHDLEDSKFQNWEDLENFGPPRWQFNTLQSAFLSIIIPHYENPFFLCAVLKNLQEAFEATSIPFEVLVVDDGSTSKTQEHIFYFASRILSTLPLKYYSWEDKPELENGEKIFRAGASRNWGASQALGHYLFFLDSDMLCPENIAELVINSLKENDVVQFIRKHVPAEQSAESSTYKSLKSSPKLYVEEAQYWDKLFNCVNWSEIPDHWKYTCTYALGIKKETFRSVGRFRRNFIQYGLEDTDLGFRLFQNNKKFYLNKTPLLHLTQRKDSSQGFIYRLSKMKRIAPTAKIFYKLHLDTSIYQKFRSLLD